MNRTQAYAAERTALLRHLELPAFIAADLKPDTSDSPIARAYRILECGASRAGAACRAPTRGVGCGRRGAACRARFPRRVHRALAEMPFPRAAPLG